MGRIALVDASDATASMVRAAFGDGAVVACRRESIPSDAALVIVEVGRAPASLATLANSDTPLLVLADTASVDSPAAFGTRRIAFLKKPFDVVDLRMQVRALLDHHQSDEAKGGATTGQNLYLSPISPGGQVQVSVPWLTGPLLTQDAASILAAACRLDGAVWIVGETGTGADRVAAALTAAWDAGREPIVWQEADSLASALARLGDAERVLWVPALEDRPLREQRSFERYLALEPARRIAVTSGDDPLAALAAGTLLRSLHDCLSRVSVRLAPLRERRDEISTLAVSIAASVASRAFGTERVVLADDARRSLEAYPWPGNFTELEAVATRSVVAAGRARASTLELTAPNLRFAPDHLAPFVPKPVPKPGTGTGFQAPDRLSGDEQVASSTSTKPGTGTGFEAPDRDRVFRDAPNPSTASTADPASAPPRRGIVVALGDAAAARAARPSDSTSTELPQVPEGARAEPAASSGVEALLAAFAHDIRNPMSTIKTFAGLQAATAGDDSSELARLAVSACERVDEHLEFLQSYAELAPTTPVPVDLVEILGEAVDAAGAADSFTICARRSLTVRTDPALARFVADAVVAECRSRAEKPGTGTGFSKEKNLYLSPISDESGADFEGDPPPALVSSADIAADGSSLEIRIPVGGAAVDRLDRWVRGASLPWRLALARDAALRSGGELQVDVEDGEMRLRWRLPKVEEGKNDDQAGSPDRRRRSRSS